MLAFPIYRAEALTEELRAGGMRNARTSLRLPANVPYVVDNLWEVLRPLDMPSRRRALYASPTRDLARESRSGSDQGLGYCVYQLEIHGDATVAQLRVTDARIHSDVKAVQKIVQSFADAIASAESTDKPYIAMLFLPGASAEDWKLACSKSTLANQISEAATAISTFWVEASARIDPVSSGEVFFELARGAKYRPIDVEVYAPA